MPTVRSAAVEEQARETSVDPAAAGRPSATEWLIVLAVVAVGGVLTAVAARHMWFNADVWAYLAERETSIDDILRPHAGHWTVWNAAVTRGLYLMEGMDFWPWWYLPRVLAWGLLCVVLWRLLRLLGTDRTISLATVVVLAVFGSTGWLQGWTIGNPIAHMAAAGCAATVLVLEPANRNRLLLAGLLVLGVTSAGIGVAVLAGMALTVVAVRGARPWWPSVVGAGGIYGAWYVWYRWGEGGSGTDVSIGALGDLPSFTFDMARSAFTRLTASPDWIGTLVVLALGVWLVAAMFKRRLSVVDTLYLGSAVAFLVLTLAVRVAAGAASPEAVRYSYTLTLFLIPVVLPRIPSLRHWTLKAAVLGLAGLLALHNLDDLRAEIEFWSDRSQSSRAVVETAAWLINRDEGILSTASVDSPRSGQLTAGGLATLVDDGWRPQPRMQAVGAARGNLRLESRITDLEVGPCTDVGMSLMVDPMLGPLILDGPADASAHISWTDERGRGELTVLLGDDGRRVLRFAEVPGASVVVRPVAPADQLRSCSLPTE